MTFFVVTFKKKYFSLKYETVNAQGHLFDKLTAIVRSHVSSQKSVVGLLNTRHEFEQSQSG